MHREYRAGCFGKLPCVSPEVVCGDIGEIVHAELDEVLGLFGEGQEAFLPPVWRCRRLVNTLG